MEPFCGAVKELPRLIPSNWRGFGSTRVRSQVRPLLEVYFDIVEEKRLDANYAANLDSLAEVIFYRAPRN